MMLKISSWERSANEPGAKGKIFLEAAGRSFFAVYTRLENGHLGLQVYRQRGTACATRTAVEETLCRLLKKEMARVPQLWEDSDEGQKSLDL